MAEEQKGDEIKEILSDLDSILSDISTPPAEPPAPTPAPAPKPAASPAAPPKPTPPLPDDTVKIPLPPQAVPKNPEPAKPPAPASGAPTIELGARPAIMPAKKVEPSKNPPPKPAALISRPPIEITVEPLGGPSNPVPVAPQPPVPAPPKAAAPPAPAPPPASAPAVPSIGAEDVPEKTPKEQIRRVAFIYAAEHKEKKDALAKFMATSAQTISKKPLYLRRVLSEEVGASADGKGILSRVEAVKAVAVLGILEGLPESKVRELTEVFAGAGILFRMVAPDEVQKRSLAVDLIVDMMLLSPES